MSYFQCLCSYTVLDIKMRHCCDLQIDKHYFRNKNTVNVGSLRVN
jgi:hypothetical protein